jgi:riboflavin synthase
MFTGLIEEVGSVKGIVGSPEGGRKFTIGCRKVMEDIAIGDSLSVNGVCLTIVNKLKNEVNVEAVEETIKKTTLGGLQSGDPVNIERAATLASRIGGHLVQGHVDTTAKVMSIERLRLSHVFRFGLQHQYMKYLIPVGSIAIDGVSLTVAEKLADSFKVAIIPHTFENTIFGSLRVGRMVNVELDMMAKYIETLLKK